MPKTLEPRIYCSWNLKKCMWFRSHCFCQNFSPCRSPCAFPWLRVSLWVWERGGNHPRRKRGFYRRSTEEVRMQGAHTRPPAVGVTHLLPDPTACSQPGSQWLKTGCANLVVFKSLLWVWVGLEPSGADCLHSRLERKMPRGSIMPSHRGFKGADSHRGVTCWGLRTSAYLGGQFPATVGDRVCAVLWVRPFAWGWWGVKDSLQRFLNVREASVEPSSQRR